MDQYNRPLVDTNIQESIRKTGKSNIKALFVVQNWPDFTNERLAYFGLNPNPVFQYTWGSLYVK